MSTLAILDGARIVGALPPLIYLGAAITLTVLIHREHRRNRR